METGGWKRSEVGKKPIRPSRLCLVLICFDILMFWCCEIIFFGGGNHENLSIPTDLVVIFRWFICTSMFFKDAMTFYFVGPAAPQLNVEFRRQFQMGDSCPFMLFARKNSSHFVIFMTWWWFQHCLFFPLYTLGNGPMGASTTNWKHFGRPWIYHPGYIPVTRQDDSLHSFSYMWI